MSDVDELPILDRARLELITRGDTALANEFLRGLIDEAGEVLARMRILLASGERSALAGLAHTLKGMAGEVGALRLRGFAAALEAESEPERWRAHVDLASAALGELQSLCAP
jgi:two-component system, sensor histidine kinase and response regulator